MSLPSSLEIMELNLRCSFGMALRNCRMSKGLSQSDLAGMLVDSRTKKGDAYLKERECWSKKIRNWENGYSLPSLAAFFYLVGLFGNALAEESIRNNKALEHIQSEDTAFHVES